VNQLRSMSGTIKPKPRMYEILDTIDGVRKSKKVTLACCLFCDSAELIVSDVEREGYDPLKWPSAVHCGGCGARGPWGWTEYRAVERWNQTCGIETCSLTEWESLPDLAEFASSDDLPF